MESEIKIKVKVKVIYISARDNELFRVMVTERNISIQFNLFILF